MKHATKMKIRNIGVHANRICSTIAVILSTAACVSVYFSGTDNYKYYMLPIWICVSIMYFTNETEI